VRRDLGRGEPRAGARHVDRVVLPLLHGRRVRRAPLLVLGVAAVGLLGAGVWLGRSSVATPAAPAPRAAEVRSARLPATASAAARPPAAARMPALRPQASAP